MTGAARVNALPKRVGDGGSAQKRVEWWWGRGSHTAPAPQLVGFWCETGLEVRAEVLSRRSGVNVALNLERCGPPPQLTPGLPASSQKPHSFSFAGA